MWTSFWDAELTIGEWILVVALGSVIVIGSRWFILAARSRSRSLTGAARKAAVQCGTTPAHLDSRKPEPRRVTGHSDSEAQHRLSRNVLKVTNVRCQDRVALLNSAGRDQQIG